MAACCCPPLSSCPECRANAELGKVSAVVVQPNIDDDTEWTPELVRRTEEQLMILSMSPALSRDRDVNLIVWPEMPAPFYDTDIDFVGRVAAIAKNVARSRAHRRGRADLPMGRL